MRQQQLDDSNSVPNMSEGLDIESDDEDGNDKDVMVPRPTVLGDSHEDIRGDIHGDIHGGREEEKEREIELETRRSTRRTARDKEDHQRRRAGSLHGQGGRERRPLPWQLASFNGAPAPIYSARTKSWRRKGQSRDKCLLR